jgi:plasmid replication initiation protein
MYEFRVVDFCKVCGIEPQGDMYRLIKDQIKNIADKSLWIELEDGNETLVRWIERPYIDKKGGIIRIKLDDEMKPYLLQLKQQFTKYDLIYTLNFKSKYSIRLYEYLKSIHFQKFQEYQQIIPIDKFQLIMDSNYKEFKDFHTRALKPAYQEINEYTDISFEYQPIKDGKRVNAIKVIVNTKSVEDRINVVRDNERLLEERCGKSK